MVGLICKKYGMSRILDNGMFIPVTIVETLPNFVTQIKTLKSDGYDAIQLGVKNGKRKIRLFNSNHFREFKGLFDNVCQGDQINASIFDVGSKVKLIGFSKGKGFQGVVKRHGFSLQGASHGVTKSHRGLGAVGMCTKPGRMLPGKKMPGRMGNNRLTIKSIILKIDKDLRYIVVKGPVPGPCNRLLVIKKESKL